MKKKWFHTADNTILGCPKVDYKYNWDTYRNEKRFFWAISFLGLLISLSVILLSKNNVTQTVAGAFMGGMLSLIVWLFTIRQQDKINYELANVDMHIMKIDEILELQCSKTQFIDPKEEELVDFDDEDVGLRFLLLLQILTLISSKKEIDTSSMRLKFLFEEEVSMEDFISKSEELLINNKFREIASSDEWEKIVSWNNWYLNLQLNELKKKLQRYRTYILCGNAPEKYSNI